MPAVGSRSFSEYGMPSRGPRSSPRRARSSAARACRRARSAVTVRYALSRGLSRSMRASTASQSSTGESARARISRPSSVAGVKQSSVASTTHPPPGGAPGLARGATAAGPDVPVGVASEALGRHGVDALAARLVGRGDAEDIGPLGPGIVRSAAVGRPRQQLELVHGARALAMHGTEAVGAGVAAADDHDVLAARGDEPVVGDRVALAALVLERQVLHREVESPALAPHDRD